MGGVGPRDHSGYQPVSHLIGRSAYPQHFCTHPIGNETRLQVGPSLGGALRPGGANTMIDGLQLPSTEGGQERWNCSDQDLRQHMAL